MIACKRIKEDPVSCAKLKKERFIIRGKEYHCLVYVLNEIKIKHVYIEYI